MKESILPLFLILLLTIETDGNTIVLRRKPISRDRCHRMQETRLCAGIPKSWHYDVRVSECRESNEEECGAVGNRFRSKDDCEKICPGSLDISARQSYIDPPRVQPVPQPGYNPCCGHNYPGPIRDPCHRQCCPNCGQQAHLGYPDCNRQCCPNCPRPSPPTLPPVIDCHRNCCPSPCPYPPHPGPGPGPLRPGPCPVYNGAYCDYHTPPPEPYYSGKSLCPSNLHCPTVCSSSRLTPELNSRCCGCRTGTIIRPPCSSHHRCNHVCRNMTDYNCGPTTTVAPTTPKPIGEVICPIKDPNTECRMSCERGFKKTSAGCPYCECEESSASFICNPLICKSTCAFGCYSNTPDCKTFTCRPAIKVLHRGVQPRVLGRYCHNIRAICRLHCPQGFVKDQHGCDMCQCIKNGLTSSTDCSLKPSCTMFCEHGFQKGSDGCDICLCSHINPDKN